MIRHMVVFRFGDEASNGDRSSLIDELRRLPDRFPAMRNFSLGANESRRDQRYSHGFTVEFADFDELDAYLNSDEHARFVSERFAPLVAERAIVSFADAEAQEDRASRR